MADWWNSLTTLQHIFGFIAIPATLVLIVQTVLLFFGIGDGEADCDCDDLLDHAHGDGGLTLVSVRGIVAMACVGGWAGIVFIDFGLNEALAIVLSALCGIAALFGIAYLMKAVMKLQSSGNLDLGQAVGKVGEVYIPIPPKGQGKGKINITIQDRFVEIDAISLCDEKLATGEAVRVVSTNEMGLCMVDRVVK